MAPSDPNPPVRPAAPAVTVNHLAGWRWLVLWPLAILLRWWTGSLRFELSETSRLHLARRAEPSVLAIWHNRLFLAAEIFRRYRQGRAVYALVSPSRDGAWSEAFHRLAGLQVVRGSSSRGGLEAARALVSVLRAGHDVGLTPDGPRGPAYDFKEGGLIVARRAGAEVLLVGATFEAAWRLPGWDRLYVPRPFSRVRIECDRVPAAEVRAHSAAELAARLRTASPDGTANDTPCMII